MIGQSPAGVRGHQTQPLRADTHEALEAGAASKQTHHLGLMEKAQKILQRSSIHHKDLLFCTVVEAAANSLGRFKEASDLLERQEGKPLGDAEVSQKLNFGLARPPLRGHVAEAHGGNPFRKVNEDSRRVLPWPIADLVHARLRLRFTRTCGHRERLLLPGGLLDLFLGSVVVYCRKFDRPLPHKRTFPPVFGALRPHYKDRPLPKIGSAPFLAGRLLCRLLFGRSLSHFRFICCDLLSRLPYAQSYGILKLSGYLDILHETHQRGTDANELLDVESLVERFQALGIREQVPDASGTLGTRDYIPEVLDDPSVRGLTHLLVFLSQEQLDLRDGQHGDLGRHAELLQDVGFMWQWFPLLGGREGG